MKIIDTTIPEFIRELREETKEDIYPQGDFGTMTVQIVEVSYKRNSLNTIACTFLSDDKKRYVVELATNSKEAAGKLFIHLAPYIQDDIGLN